MASKNKTKKIVGIVVIVIGLVIFLLGLYARGRVSDARSDAKHSTGMLGDNPVGKKVNEAIEHKIGSYDSPVFWTIVGGIVVMVIGACTVCRCKKKR